MTDCETAERFDLSWQAVASREVYLPQDVLEWVYPLRPQDFMDLIDQPCPISKFCTKRLDSAQKV